MKGRRSMWSTYLFLVIAAMYMYNVHRMQDEVASRIVIQVTSKKENVQSQKNEYHSDDKTSVRVDNEEFISDLTLSNREAYEEMKEAALERRNHISSYNYSNVIAMNSSPPVVIIMTDPPGRTGELTINEYTQHNIYIRMVIIVTASISDCKSIKNTVQVQCLVWPRVSPTAEYESHLDASNLALAFLYPKPSPGVNLHSNAHNVKFILFTTSLISIGHKADKYSTVGKSFLDGMLFEANKHPEATIVGSTWVSNKPPYRIMNTGFTIEWDYLERPYVRGLNSGYKYTDEKSNPVLISTSVMLVPAVIFSREMRGKLPEINKQPGLYRHEETICAVKDTIVTIELLTIAADEVFDVVLSSEDAPRDFLFQATSLKAHLQRVRRVTEQLDQYIQTDTINCRLKFPPNPRVRDAILFRIRSAEQLQRNSQKLSLLCVGFNDDCKVREVMVSLETQLSATSLFLSSTISSIAHWKASSGFAPLDQPGSWSYLFNLTFQQNYNIKTSSSRVYCCNFKSSDLPQTLPVLKQMFSPLNIDLDKVTEIVVEEPSRYILSQKPMENMPLDVYRTWEKHIKETHERQASRISIIWSAWCCQCCGFSNEWAHYLHPLEEKIKISAIPGPECHCNGLTNDVLGTIQRSHISEIPFSEEQVRVDSPGSVLVWISHTPPTNFVFNRKDFHGNYDYFVGRSMYEFSAIPKSWVEPSNNPAVNEIWVPSKFVRNAFIDSGINSSKLVVMPEGIDCKFYDQESASYLQLPSNIWNQYNSNTTLRHLRGRHVFLSIFKWEPRKGGDILIRNYINEFTSEDPVTLVVSTYRWYPGSPETWGPTRDPAIFQLAIEQFAESEGVDMSRIPHIIVITENLAEEDIRNLYAACDTFVLPTRGEGWGLPIIQAMSMGLPTISTAWGGAMAFMTPFNSFPLKYRIVDISPEAADEYQVQGVRWAEPDADHLRHLMRQMMTNRSHAIEIGKAARADIVVQFNEPVIADKIMTRLKEIEKIVIANRTH